MRIVITSKAKQHIRQATLWYEQQQAGLGARFVDYVTATLDEIRSGPLRRPIILGDVRFSILKTFPYLVLYRIRPDHVRVLAVLHASRDPLSWQQFL